MKSTHIGLKKGGFTLIELLVVIVIIGILASIAIATFSGFFAQARDANRKAVVQQLNQIVLASQISANTAAYDFGATGATALADMMDSLETEVTSAGFTIPAAVNNHDYAYGGTGTNYVVAVCLEDDGTLYARGTTAGIADVDVDGSSVCTNGDGATVVTTPELDATPATLTEGATGNFGPIDFN